jgi:hypothetical protein
MATKKKAGAEKEKKTAQRRTKLRKLALVAGVARARKKRAARRRAA